MGNYEYVSKSEVRPYKKLFEDVFKEIQKELKKKNGLTFSVALVGSAKRNLVVRHHNKGFDCDYQLYLQRNKQALSAEEVKKLLIKKFDEKMPDEYDYCEDSTSSITIKKKITKQSKIEFSYDIVIMDLYEDASYILRKNGSGQYVWNQLPDFTSFEDDYRQIEGADMWEDLRQCYYDKKIAKNNGSPKYKDKKSFQLLHQAVKETLSRF
jgi:hypothetical protein